MSRHRRSGRSRGAVALLVTVALWAFGCGTADLGPPTADVTGFWTGTWSAPYMGSGTLDFRLEQKGAAVTGDLIWRGSMEGPRAGASLNPTGALKGSVAGRTFSFDRTPSPVKGDLTVEGDVMKGIVILSQAAMVTVHRQR